MGVTFIALALSTFLLAQASLRIATPAPGTVVNPGQTIVVYVEASGGPFLGVEIGAPDPIIGARGLTNPPYQFGLTIPAKTTPGLYPLVASGNTTAGTDIGSAPVMIDVERSDSPQSITCDVTGLDLAVGEQTLISVTATYADGSHEDLTKSTQTQYDPTPPGIISVSAQGRVTGLKAGTATLTIRHKEQTAGVINVFVISAPKKDP